MKLNPLLEQTAQTFDHSPTNTHNWETISKRELEVHILTTHCEPFIMQLLGIPNYDLEVAAERGFDLGGICQGLYKKLLSRGTEYFHHPSPIFPADQKTYLEQIVKTLLFADQLQPGVVNWQLLDQLFPEHRSIKLNIAEDTQDVSFRETLKIREQLQVAISQALFGWLEPPI